jgi:hypothetical protein
MMAQTQESHEVKKALAQLKEVLDRVETDQFVQIERRANDRVLDYTAQRYTGDMKDFRAVITNFFNDIVETLRPGESIVVQITD